MSPAATTGSSAVRCRPRASRSSPTIRIAKSRNPSLRYIVHLNAPGWNVIGACEPPFVGVAIGHNERVAWGLTIVGTDQHDVYVEEVNPANRERGEVATGSGSRCGSSREEIAVKGGAAADVELKFTRHGPIFYEDRARHRAYALRSALHEPGTAPYLAGLRLSQARTAASSSTPRCTGRRRSENLICGDVDGNIAWQASALDARRAKGWSGRLPVPGTGAYEWDGFRTDLPRELNPARGFIATANNNIQPKGYAPPLMFKTADTRVRSHHAAAAADQPGRRVLRSTITSGCSTMRTRCGRRPDIRGSAGWTSNDPHVERARKMLSRWDAVYARDSARGRDLRNVARLAGIGSERRDREDLRPCRRSKPGLRKAIDAADQEPGRRLARMALGADAHASVPASVRRSASTCRPSSGRGGAGTVAADGATYREILDVADWDRSIVTNVPGQSGQPGSPYYGNLLPLWAENRYFSLAFTRKAVEGHAAHTLILRPR